MKSFVATLLLLLVFTGPALAVTPPIIDDLPGDDGGEPPWGGPGGPKGEGLCRTCCQTRPDWICQEEGCICSKLPDYPSGCAVAYSAERFADDREGAVALLSMLGRLSDHIGAQANGKKYIELKEQYGARLIALFAKQPRLAKRTWSVVLNLSPGLSSIQDARVDRVLSREELSSFRKLLQAIARADTRLNDGALAKAIKTTVLPGLTPKLAGMRYEDALACYLSPACHD